MSVRALIRAAAFVRAIVIALLLATPEVQAKFRFTESAGAWTSHFWQQSGDRKASVNSKPSLAISTQLGASVSAFFFEWSPTWFIPAYSENPKANDASYYSLLGGNVGIDLHPLPLEIYTGAEDGHYGLAGGVNPDYDGLTLKIGAAVYFVQTPVDFGIRAEYRRFFAQSDDAGKLPDWVTTRADLFMLALTFGWR